MWPPQQLSARTNREHEVATAVGAGTSNAEIAASLSMSEATVKAPRRGCSASSTPGTVIDVSIG